MPLPKILIIDDEPDVRDFLSYNIKKEGFRVYTANNGKHGLQKAIDTKADLIILDVMMPDMDGIEVCEKIRQTPNINNSLILILSARNEDYSLEAGFEAGADDYITKPVNPKVLIRRINALLKRLENEHIYSRDKKSFTNKNIIKIDTEKYTVHYDGKEHVLPCKQYELLNLLISDAGKVFTRDEIYNALWGQTIVGERTIDVHIRKLRERLGSHHIVTVKGVGYKFMD